MLSTVPLRTFGPPPRETNKTTRTQWKLTNADPPSQRMIDDQTDHPPRRHGRKSRSVLRSPRSYFVFTFTPLSCVFARALSACPSVVAIPFQPWIPARAPSCAAAGKAPSSREWAHGGTWPAAACSCSVLAVWPEACLRGSHATPCAPSHCHLAGFGTPGPSNIRVTSVIRPVVRRPSSVPSSVVRRRRPSSSSV